MKNILH